MSSRKLSDKEFDRYARNILKKPEGIVFDESAWVAMEKQLAQNGASSTSASLRWLIPAVLLLMTSLGYLGYQKVFDTNKNSSVLVSNENSTAKIIPNHESNSDNASNQLTESTATSNSNVVSENESTVSNENSRPTENIDSKSNQVKHVNNSVDREASLDNVEKGIAKESSAITKSSGSEELTTPVIENSSSNEGKLPTEGMGQNEESNAQVTNPTNSNTESHIATDKNEESENGEIVDGDNYEDEAIGSGFEIIEIEYKYPILTLANVQHQTPEPLPPDHDNNAQLLSDSHEREIIQTPFNRWSLGVVIAPDFTTVGQLNEFTRPGIDIGITVEYFILKRLSITTGAILTRKLYNTTDIEEYTVPAGFWNGNDGPSEIAANCKVIDIPINLRYRIREGERTSFFLSAGMSSYLMLTERYDYDYNLGYRASLGSRPGGWEVANENNHFFGVYNLSAGINRKISKNMSIEAEPFLKNTLGGVGWGQVRLSSTGMLLHLKYNLK
ncbi:hypothetical protein [Ekhidna sp.]